LKKETVKATWVWDIVFTSAVMLGLIVVLVLSACSSDELSPKDPTQKAIEAIAPITAVRSGLPWTSAEIDERVNNCGPGVVKGQAGENRCGSEQIDLTDMITNPKDAKLGLLEDPDFPKGATFWQPTVIDTPKAYDLRSKMKQLPQVRDQAWNDCWANASASGFELSRAVKDPTATMHSVQSIISCSGKGTAAAGGYMSAAQESLHGLPLESDFPYVGKDVKCKFTKDQWKAGWEPKAVGTPYIGNSLMYSKYFKPGPDGKRSEEQEKMFQKLAGVGR
jgi:hypothetical protein